MGHKDHGPLTEPDVKLGDSHESMLPMLFCSGLYRKRLGSRSVHLRQSRRSSRINRCSGVRRRLSNTVRGIRLSLAGLRRFQPRSATASRNDFPLSNWGCRGLHRFDYLRSSGRQPRDNRLYPITRLGRRRWRFVRSRCCRRRKIRFLQHSSSVDCRRHSASAVSGGARELLPDPGAIHVDAFRLRGSARGFWMDAPQMKSRRTGDERPKPFFTPHRTGCALG